MLFLVEGALGVGKRSTAQYLRNTLSGNGQSVRWWFRLDSDHPVYLFQTDDELGQCVADLTAGRFKPVVQSALVQWERFADGLRESETAIVLDGCLFTYLTDWLLFYGETESVIEAYVHDVVRIIAPCDPRLVLLRPSNVGRSLASVCSERGDEWTDRHIEATELSPIGQRLQLRGFNGLVRYWTEHRRLTDRLFAALPFATLVAPGPAEDWHMTRTLLADFLSIKLPEARNYSIDLRQLAGQYATIGLGSEVVCEVSYSQGALYIFGHPWFGERCHLVRRGPSSFDLESFPFTLTFTVSSEREDHLMTVAGPDVYFRRRGEPVIFERVNRDVRSYT